MSALQILGSDFASEFKRLGITQKNWDKMSRKAARQVPDDIDDDEDKCAEFEQKFLQEWIGDLEADLSTESRPSVRVSRHGSISVSFPASDREEDDIAPMDILEETESTGSDSSAVLEDSTPSDGESETKTKPKRPSNSYSKFSSSKRAEVKMANPDMTAKDIVSLLSKMWRELPPAEKEPFVKLAQDDKERYKKEMAAYVPSGKEAASKKEKTKKAKKNTSSKKCCARKWSGEKKGARNGLKQCSRNCKTDEHQFCSSCQSASDRFDGLAGPDLWKWCAENDKTREDTKGKGNSSLWFGTMDQVEGDTNYPASSFTDSAGQVVVVLAYPDHEQHSVIEQNHLDSGAVLGHKLLNENWSKSWHLIGRTEKDVQKALKKGKPVKADVVVAELFTADGVIAEFEDDDEEETSSNQDKVAVKNDGDTYIVNHMTFEVVDDDGDMIGKWVMSPDAPDKPEEISEIQAWISSRGFPDDDAESWSADQNDDE